jgi:hypothetical protein
VLQIIYKVKIENSALCECENEGDLIIRLNERILRAYFQTDKDFYDNYILPSKNKEIEVDLWLVYGTPRKIDLLEMNYPIGTQKAGGTYRGIITNIINEEEFILDCGLKIDVSSEIKLTSEFKVGEFIEITGTYQAFFPKTKFSKE